VPGKALIRQWLRAGYLEDGVFHATPQGTPQGGVISPLLLKVALHGWEDALAINPEHRTNRRAVVRYADDLVILCETQAEALHVRDHILPAWLAPRGLPLSPAKTRVVHLREGFDFLGCNVRHYPTPQTTRTGWKWLIKPSKPAVTRKRQELRVLGRQLKGQPIQAVLHRLNPLIRGWANYYRTVVSSRTFAALDNWMHHRAVRYAKHTHPQKAWTWRRQRYWGRLNPARQDQHVFGDQDSGRSLLKFSWFSIRRHILVTGRASPDDPSLRDYGWERRKVNIRHLTASEVALAEQQDWLCRVCGMSLSNGEDLHRHHRHGRAHGGSDTYANRELVHLYCQQQLHARGPVRPPATADE
jgi:RNA-directed DNA polymerase